MTMQINKNRFQLGLHHGSPEATHKARQISNLPAGEMGLDEARKILGGDSPVFARRITTDEFIAKVEEALKTIVAAEKFDVADQEKIRMDPLLAAGFRGFIDLMMANQVSVTAQKRTDALVLERRFMVVQYLELFREKLMELKELRAATPVDLTQLGLEMIQRNTEIQGALERPLSLATTLNQMAGLSGLDAAAKKQFLYRLARAAVQEVQISANQTQEIRSAAASWLRHALTRLVALGETKGQLMEYYNESNRLADKLDAGEGSTYRIASEAIFLGSAEEADRKSAEARLRIEMAKLKEASEARKDDTHLGPKMRDSFESMLKVSLGSAALFREMPDFIALMKQPAFDEAGSAFRANADELATHQKLVTSFINGIGQVFPSLDAEADRVQHQEVCEAAQAMVLELTGTAQDGNYLGLVRELTRNPPLAARSIEIADKFITTERIKLDAFGEAVLGHLDSGRIELAYENFHRLNGPGDGTNQQRQAEIFAKATETLVKLLARDKKIEAPEPVQEWLQSSYLRGIESSLSLETPWPAMAVRILTALAGSPIKLQPQEVEDLVGKVQAMATAAAFPVTPFIPALVGLLGTHPDDIGAMNKVKELVDTYLAERPTYLRQPEDDPRWATKAIHAFPFNGSKVGLQLIEDLSKLELASGNVRRVAECLLETDETIKVAMAERIPLLGEFAIKDELARLINAEANPEAIPDVALPLATVDATLAIARDLIPRYAGLHLGTEVKDLDQNTQQGLIKLEAALRIATPNVMSASAMVGLVRAVQAQTKPPEVLHLMRSWAPNDLIKEILMQIDDASIRDFLAGKARRERGKQGELPEAGEVIGVPVVEAGAEKPTE